MGKPGAVSAAGRTGISSTLRPEGYPADDAVLRGDTFRDAPLGILACVKDELVEGLRGVRLGHNAGPIGAPCDPTAGAPRQLVQRELRSVLEEFSVVLK